MRGFTLIELVLVLAAVALLLQGWYGFKQALIAEAVTERTVGALVLIDEAAYQFHVELGRWPDNLAELRGTTPPLLPGCLDGSAAPCGAGNDPIVNGIGGGYVLQRLGTPPADYIEVTTTMLDDDQAARVQRSFPHRTRVGAPGTGEVVFQQTADPGDQTEHELLVWRDGTRTMTAALDFDGNAAAALSTAAFDAAADFVAGAACGTTKRIGTQNNGTLMECVAGTWRMVGSGVGTAKGIPCGWTGTRSVNEFNIRSWSGCGGAGYAAKTGIGVFWTCAGNEVSNVRSGSCEIRDYTCVQPRRAFSSGDCTF